MLRLSAKSSCPVYRLVLPARFALAHLARIDAAIFALHAADIFLLGFCAGVAAGAAALYFAHLALAAAAIAARPAALIFLLGFCAGAADGAVPFILAHLARAAAAIAARPAALIFLFLGLSGASAATLTGAGTSPPSS